MITDVTIHNYLTRLGISPAHKGYFAMVEAIKLTDANPQIPMGMLYTRVANKFNSTCQRVERRMRFVCQRAIDKGDIYLLQEIFGYNIKSNGRGLTNSEFIKDLTMHITVKEASVQ